MSADVTVVIPTFRRPETVSRAIECALDQRGVSVDVVVVDDCSGDGTLDVLRRRYDTDVRVFAQPVNGGVSRARNRGLAEARAAYVSFLDDDDVWSPTKLRSQLDALSSASVEWAYSEAVVCNERLEPIRIDRATRERPLAYHALERYSVPVACSNVLVDTSVARELGGFDPAYFHNADWDFIIRLALRGDPAVVDAHDVGYVLHSANVSGIQRGKYEDLERLEMSYAPQRAALGARSSRLESLRWIGMSSARVSQRLYAAKAYLHAFRISHAPYDLVRAGAVFLPRYGSLMDWKQARRLRRVQGATGIEWLHARSHTPDRVVAPGTVAA